MLTPNDHTIEKELRDLKRRISALERANNSVGDLSEIADSLTVGNGSVTIDDNGISILGDQTGTPNAIHFNDDNKHEIGTIRTYFNSTDTYLAFFANGFNSQASNIEFISTGTAPTSLRAGKILLEVDDGTNDRTISMWSSVDTVGFGNVGIDISEQKLKTGNTGCITGGNETISDDSVYSFTPACARGVLILRGPGSDSTTYAMLTYAATSGTAYTISWIAGSNTNVTTGALTGTTGTDGKLTISAHTDGKIYIENRRGGSRAVAWNILAGA